MKETLTDIINKFILTSLVDIEEEYHDEVKSMMQLIGTQSITHSRTHSRTHSLKLTHSLTHAGLINYMKVYSKRRINRYELTKLYDLGVTSAP